MIRNVLAVFAVAVVLYACGNDDSIPSNVLKLDKMQAVMWDIVRADVFTVEYIKRDSVKNLQQENLRLQKKIFALNNITHEQYYRSYEYYKSKPELMKALLDTMAARVNRSRNGTSTPTVTPQ